MVSRAILVNSNELKHVKIYSLLIHLVLNTTRIYQINMIDFFRQVLLFVPLHVV